MAQKCVDVLDKTAFAGLSAAKAKRWGQQVKLRPDWEDVRIGVVEEVIRAKFSRNIAEPEFFYTI